MFLTLKAQFFLRSIIYLLLIGQLWINIAPNYYWVVDCGTEHVEHHSSESSEAEGEDSKDEKKNELLQDVLISNLYAKLAFKKNFNTACLISIFHPEITTPPPEPYLS